MMPQDLIRGCLIHSPTSGAAVIILTVVPREESAPSRRISDPFSLCLFGSQNRHILHPVAAPEVLEAPTACPEHVWFMDAVPRGVDEWPFEVSAQRLRPVFRARLSDGPTMGESAPTSGFQPSVLAVEREARQKIPLTFP